MKKTLIALAVAGISFNAAAVNLDGTTAAEIKTITFAKEQNVADLTYGKPFVEADAGNAANSITDQLVVKAKAGFALDQQHFVRIDLSNGATFKTLGKFFTATGGSALSAAKVGSEAGTATAVAAGEGLVNLAAVTTGSNETGALYEVSTGGVGESFVIFKSVAIASGVEQTVGANDELVAAFTANLANQGDVKATYGLYTSVAEALNESRPVVQKAGTLLNFDTALVVNAQNAAGQKSIDVASGSTKFDTAPDTQSPFAALTVKVDGDVNAQLNTLEDATINAVIDATESQWVLNGDFSFATALDQGLEIADNKQSASVKAGNVGDVTITVNGTDEISDSSYTAVFTPKVNPGFSLASQTFGDITLGKNGSSATVSLGLNPNSSFTQYVRVSNKSGIAGKVRINVIDDNGVSAQVTLAELGQPAELAGRSSSASLKLKDIFAAAQANATTALNDKGMLRLKVEGETPENTLSVQSYSVAKDGTTFSVF